MFKTLQIRLMILIQKIAYFFYEKMSGRDLRGQISLKYGIMIDDFSIIEFVHVSRINVQDSITIEFTQA